MPEQELYMIQSGFVGNCMLFWGKDDRGYTCHLDRVGEYTLEQAKARARDYEGEMIWPVDTIKAGASTMVDHQKVDYDTKINPVATPPQPAPPQPKCEACGKFTPRDGNPYLCPHCGAGV